MNFYLLFTVFLYIGGCNSRVVPLDFKVNKCKRADSSITENELIDEPITDEVEILGHKLPDIEKGEELELLDSERDSTIAPEISSSLSADLTSKTKAMDEELNLESAASLVISDILEELVSTSEFGSQNKSDSTDSFEAIQVNGILNDEATEDTRFKNETFIINNSSLDLEQRNNLDLVKIEEKELNDIHNQSETFEVVTSDQNKKFVSFVVYSDQNEASALFQVVNSTNITDDSFELQPFSNDTKGEVFLSDAENISDKFVSSELTSENVELTSDSVETPGVILSGFEFLINSEVARNAAKAMEVFNFSDPLTDHIIEENEFHSFLPAFNPVMDLDSPNLTDLNTITITNSSEESNKIKADLNTSLPSDNETSLLLNPAESEETKKDSSIPINLNKPLGEGNKTELFDLKEKFEGNVASEISSPLENSEKTDNATKATGSKNNVTVLVTNSVVVGTPKCPPPGLCILWFLSQDTCAVNEHCLGNRICCQIGCSKTCIEVESL